MVKLRTQELYQRDVFAPMDRQGFVLRCRRSVRSLAPRGRVPTIAMLNGKYFLSHAWRRKLRDGDQLVFFICFPTDK